MNLQQGMAAALAIAGAASVPALADTVDADGTRTLDQILVKGERIQQSTNQNVTVVDDEQLESEMAQSFEDVTRYIPGVGIADMGRFGDNGFNIRGLEGDRVALVVDGLSMPEGLETARDYEFFRAGRGGVDIDALKSIEIVKGADAIGAGSGALGGAVILTTKDASDYLRASGNDTHLRARLGYTGYNDEALGSLTFANRTGIVESMLVYTRREAHEAEGFYDDTEAETGSARRLPDPIDHESSNVLGKLDFVLGADQRLGLVYERNRVENRVENLSRVSAPGYLERRGEDRNERDRYGANYRWQANAAAFDLLEAQVDRQETESIGLTRILAGSGCPGGGAPCDRTEDRSTEQVLDRAALDLAKTVAGGGASHEIVYGGAWQQRDIDFRAVDTRWRADGTVDSVTVDPAQVPETKAESWNVYLRDRIGLADDRVQLTLGARYDRYDYSPRLDESFVDETGTVRDLSFAAPSWQAGASWTFLPRQSLWLQVGRGFRAPTTGELYAPTGTAIITETATGTQVEVPTVASNPDLDAERSLNMELGYRWQGERARFGLSVFRDRYDDFIDTVTEIRNPDVQYDSCGFAGCSTSWGYTTTTTANVGEATVEGVEAEGQWRLGDAWLLRAAYSHNEGEQEDGTPLESINPDRAVAGLSWQGLDDRLRLTGNLTHARGKDRDDVEIATDIFGQEVEPFLSDSYTVFDLFGSYQASERLRFNAGVYNLFDEEYYQWARIRNITRGDFYLYGYATDEGIGRFSEPGRNYRVTVSFDF